MILGLVPTWSIGGRQDTEPWGYILYHPLSVVRLLYACSLHLCISIPSVDLVVLMVACLFSLFYLPNDIAIAATMNSFGHFPFGNPKISCNAREYDTVCLLTKLFDFL